VAGIEVSAPAVQARAIGRAFGGRKVLRGVDLDLAAGEFVAVIGTSGSGKSTLLRILAGLDRGATGDLLVSPRRMMVFQDPRLLPWLRALDNVVLGLPAASTDHGRAMLAEVGLRGYERAWPVTLSGGEAQRVALARALVRAPQLLLLDEPFGALDALTRISMHGLLRRLHAAHRPATVLVTHDIGEALTLADRVLVLRDGRITTDLSVDRSGPPLEAMRERLLADLGVDSADPPAAPG
jgi:sulfonate transport system ATP-binding protein